MYEKVFLGIIGVAVGWLLNTASAYSKYRFEYKTHSGKALAYLLVILDQLAMMNENLEKWKDHVKCWNEFEVLREYKMRKHFLAAEELSENVEKAFLELAAYDPIYAQYLLTLKNALAFHRTVKMDRIVEVQEVYIKALSSWETVLIATEQTIRQDTLRLARQHGFLTWFKLKKRLRKHEEVKSALRLSDDLYKSYETLRDNIGPATSNTRSDHDRA